MASNLIKVWKNKGKILEGVKNSVFKQEHIEEIAAERMAICNSCEDLDKEGSKCAVSGTHPCCGQCGCSLKFKVRSLSSGCGNEENPKWDPVVNTEEEDQIKETLNSKED